MLGPSASKGLRVPRGLRVTRVGLGPWVVWVRPAAWVNVEFPERLVYQVRLEEPGRLEVSVCPDLPERPVSRDHPDSLVCKDPKGRLEIRVRLDLLDPSVPLDSKVRSYILMFRNLFLSDVTVTQYLLHNFVVIESENFPF